MTPSAQAHLITPTTVQIHPITLAITATTATQKIIASSIKPRSLLSKVSTTKNPYQGRKPVKARKAPRYQKGIFWNETISSRYQDKARTRQRLYMRNARETLILLDWNPKVIQQSKTMQQFKSNIAVWKTQNRGEISPNTPFYSAYRTDYGADYTYYMGIGPARVRRQQ